MRKILTLAATMALLAGGPVQAETIKLVTGNDYKPFTDESLPQGGMVTDLVRQAYEQAGYDVSFKFIPWKRAERAVLKGDAVATFPYVKTADRLKKYAYSEAVFVSNVVPIVKAADAGLITSYDDMKGKRSCYPLGWKLGIDKLDNMLDSDQIDTNRPREMASCYKMLEKGRIDFIPAEKATAMLDAEEALGTLDKIHFEEFILGSTPLHLIFDKGGETTQQEVDTFNKALQGIKDNGTYDKIVDEHMS